MAAIVVVSTLFSTPMRGQTVQGTLMGEKSHKTIEHALLALVDDSGRVADTTRSDSISGTFFLSASGNGLYHLRVLVGHGGLSNSGVFQLDSGQTLERTFVVPDWSEAFLQAYLADDVTTPAHLAPRQAPRYPDAARARFVAGAAVLQFVVKPDGRADPGTLIVVSSDGPSFAQAVADFAVSARFTPAQRGSVTVSQVYELPVDFGFVGDSARIHGKDGLVIRALVHRPSP